MRSWRNRVREDGQHEAGSQLGSETEGVSVSVLLDIPRENSQRTLALRKRKWIRCWHAAHKNVLLSRKMFSPRDSREL